MKQTQTKLFDFSDAGLDFCAGSKSLFPDRFKKMLTLGYNEQTVSSVAVVGNQVTFTYGGVHGYVADRVLKVNSPSLLTINNGEFSIDSVTANTVTLTIDNAPLSIAGGFTTHVAPLGYELVYEQANIHVYKFKALDESDLYLRLCFQNISTRRNCISPCVGKTFDIATGFITDDAALNLNKGITSPGAGFKWEYGFAANMAGHDTYTYTQGVSTYGLGIVVGSPYHFCIMCSRWNSNTTQSIHGVFPTVTQYDLQKVVLLGDEYGDITQNGGPAYQYVSAYCGNIKLRFKASANASLNIFDSPTVISSFLPSTIDGFNTTTAQPLSLYTHAESQHLGYLYGLYHVLYAATSAPSFSQSNTPIKTYDIDFEHSVFIHPISASGSATSSTAYLAVALEKIKID